IYLVRGEKVMLDSDLAQLYGVTTSRLNEQVKRNIDRFPRDFAFQLTRAEFDSLRSQIAILKDGGRGPQGPGARPENHRPCRRRSETPDAAAGAEEKSDRLRAFRGLIPHLRQYV